MAPQPNVRAIDARGSCSTAIRASRRFSQGRNHNNSTLISFREAGMSPPTLRAPTAVIIVKQSNCRRAVRSLV